MKINIEITEDKFKLLSNLVISSNNDSFHGIDIYGLRNGRIGDMALLLGLNDKMIPGTETNFMGYEEKNSNLS